MTTVRLNGTTLWYHEQGAGPPVLFIHGTGDYSAFFRRAAELTGASCRAIVYDRRGYAGSSERLATGLAQHVEDAAALLEHLDAAPAVIVGSSAGGV